MTVSDRASGWLGPVGVMLLAFALRVWHLGYPKRLLFDETYYAKDAFSLTRFGYVQESVERANNLIVDGRLAHVFTGAPSQIVHPDGGKWIIAAGEWVFGMNPFGWRIAAAVIGSLTVLVLARLVRRLTGSTVLGCVAGLLLCFDGLHFVLSRLALLDVFLAFWLVCAVACLVADHDWIGQRLDRVHVLRPWQIAAGLCFGMACGTKWSGVYVLAGFGLTMVVLEVLARRRRWTALTASSDTPRSTKPGWISGLLVAGVPAFVTIVGLALLVYLATWTGFLLHHGVYEARFGHGYGTNRAWGAYLNRPAHGWWGESIDALRSLWHYHVMTYDFHTGSYLAGKTHPYQSDPIGWLVLERPVGVDAQNNLSALSCGAAATSSCMRQVLLLGNPILWWTGAIALIASPVAWIATRDWRWSLPVVGVAATWLPWFLYDDRPIFSFYAVVILPFTIIAIVLVLDRWWRSAATVRSRYRVWLMTGLFLTAVIASFWFFHPIYTDALISHSTWSHRMWFNRWI